MCKSENCVGCKYLIPARGNFFYCTLHKKEIFNPSMAGCKFKQERRNGGKVSRRENKK